MDIGSASLDGRRNQMIDETDDGSFACDILQPVDVIVAGLACSRLRVVDDLADGRLAFAMKPLKGRIKLVGKRDATDDGLADSKAHGFGRIVVARIDHCEHDPRRAIFDRQDMPLAQKFAGEAVFKNRCFGIIGYLNERQP